MDGFTEKCSSKQDLFWMVFDTIKRDFYDLIRKRIEDFDWEDPRKCMEKQISSETASRISHFNLLRISF
jgi:hypothetical protein